MSEVWFKCSLFISIWCLDCLNSGARFLNLTLSLSQTLWKSYGKSCLFRFLRFLLFLQNQNMQTEGPRRLFSRKGRSFGWILRNTCGYKEKRHHWRLKKVFWGWRVMKRGESGEMLMWLLWLWSAKDINSNDPHYRLNRDINIFTVHTSSDNFSWQ